MFYAAPQKCPTHDRIAELVQDRFQEITPDEEDLALRAHIARCSSCKFIYFMMQQQFFLGNEACYVARFITSMAASGFPIRSNSTSVFRLTKHLLTCPLCRHHHYTVELRKLRVELHCQIDPMRTADVFDAYRVDTLTVEPDTSRHEGWVGYRLPKHLTDEADRPIQFDGEWVCLCQANPFIN